MILLEDGRDNRMRQKSYFSDAFLLEEAESESLGTAP